MSGFQRLEGASEATWRSLLGRKVSIRYRLESDPQHPVSEAIGIVMSVKPDESGAASVTIVNRRGEEVTISIEDVLAGKAWVGTE
jgi:hypothetical protein